MKAATIPHTGGQVYHVQSRHLERGVSPLKPSYPTTSIQFLYRLFRYVLPITRTEIGLWVQRARQIPDRELRKQALASIRSKRFHADGGSVYASVSLTHSAALVRLIIALQTISDYLDNLCDRTESYDGADFEQLHHAMRDAVRPLAPIRDYYSKRGGRDDGGYLRALVETCQQELAALPGYPVAQPYVEWLVERYCELQVHKHIEPTQRTERLMAWWHPFADEFPEISWWEFAAATGSTLGMFSLFLASVEPRTPAEVEQLFRLYFPWVGGLHILLDYLIDLHEDQVEGDFNFVQCYPTPADARRRIKWFVCQSLERIRPGRSDPRIHRDVVKGLLGMYLSDAKVRSQKEVRAARWMVWRFGPTALMYYGACRFYRFVR